MTMKILIVDDSRSGANLLSYFIKKSLECTIFFAQNFTDGIALAKKEGPDAIILDLVANRGTYNFVEMFSDRDPEIYLSVQGVAAMFYLRRSVSQSCIIGYSGISNFHIRKLFKNAGAHFVSKRDYEPRAELIAILKAVNERKLAAEE